MCQSSASLGAPARGADASAPAMARSLQATPRRRGSARSFARQRFLVIVGWLAVLLAVAGSWQIAATHGVIDPVFTGMPSRIAVEFLRSITGPPLTVDTFATVTAALIGSGLASVVGVACAFALSQSDVWRRIFDPYFTVLNGLPRVALAPLFLLWFGIGPTSKIMLAASITFFVMFYNTMAGVDSVERDHLLLARAIGASRLQVFMKFVV